MDVIERVLSTGYLLLSAAIVIASLLLPGYRLRGGLIAAGGFICLGLGNIATRIVVAFMSLGRGVDTVERYHVETLLNSLVLTVVIGLIVWFFNDTYQSSMEKTHGRRCPKCRCRKAETIMSRSVQMNTTIIKTRRITYLDLDENPTGYSETDYEVPVVRRATITELRCRVCRHTWMDNV